MSNKIFVLAILALIALAPVSFSQPATPFCCGSPTGFQYPDFWSCYFSSCNQGCYICDFSQFGYNCQGYYGYKYHCEGDQDDTNPSLDVDFESSCDGNVVTVDPAEGHVSVKEVPSADLIASGDTDDGEFTFQGCGMKVDVKVTKSGFSSETFTEELVDCSECEELPQPECTENPQCAVTEQCVNEECVPVQCGACQEVVNHACENLCASDEQCVDNACKKPEQPGCSSDLQCEDTESCNIPSGLETGNCEPVQPGACGEVKNHAFVPFGYECGPEAGCPSCSEGFTCVDHQCVQNDVTCPTTGIVGDEKTCAATENGQACANCDFEVTDPSGKTSSGKTDEEGNFNLPLNVEGTYKVALLKNGTVVKTIEVKAFPQGAPGEPEKPGTAGPDAFSLLWLIVLLLLIVGVIVYWRSRQKKG